MKAKMKAILAMTLSLLLLSTLLPAYVHASSEAKTVTVYFTLSNDGDFVTASDGTVMAHVPVTVEYYDLAEYGLDRFYRYEAYSFDEGGEYKPGSSAITYAYQRVGDPLCRAETDCG